ncbi:UbiH/UbiF family hydroxylase [Mangrovicella endophytica]|uniref:UbiH/UbiF family hydroxylase n=1 Tax=Mangrovicella endophytica TaxID=2066697 RepID=UPI001FE2166C|nr:UbiH/UbiF family hydroxylase [Mangrovicella endophytica]
MTRMKRDVAVVGGGLAGYAAAIGLADAGFDTVLVAPRSERADGRTTALLGRSVALLADLGVLDVLKDKGEPMEVMRLVDDTRRLFKAPTVEFAAAEVDLLAFGYNITNEDLLEGLRARAASLADRLEIIDAAATAVSFEAERVTVTLDNGDSYSAALAVAADGRHSMIRDAAGIAVRRWAYPQAAVVMNIAHTLPHGRISTEFHRRPGPLAQVPLPGMRSGIVFVEEPQLAERYAAMPRERLARIVEDAMHSLVGAVEIDGPVQRYPLSGATATRFAGDRVALVGETAHIFPPIGAQGFNLSLRDVESLIRAVSDSRDDPGSRSVLARYEAARRGDVVSRTAGVHVLNRSLLADFLPVQVGRTLGLSALAAIAPLRRFAVREGLSPGAGLLGLPRSVRERIGWEHA